MAQKVDILLFFPEAFTGGDAGFAGGDSLDHAIQLSDLPLLLVQLFLDARVQVAAEFFGVICS